MLAYADLFTMSTIALNRCFGIVFKHSQPLVTRMFSSKGTIIICILIWVITFLIICPTTFGVKGFGTFGYDPSSGKCEFKQKDGIEDGIRLTGWYSLFACTTSCLVIIGSYIVLSLYIKVQSRRLACVLTNNVSKVSKYSWHQNKICDDFLQMESRNTQINVTLCVLALSYFLFSFAQLPLELGILNIYLKPETSVFVSTCLFVPAI